MTRTLIALALLACSAAPARSETLPLFDGLPTTYTPGTPFSFTVRVPNLSDFTEYVVELVLETNVGDPDLFAVATPAPVAPAGRYVFPSNVGFTSTLNASGGSQNLRLFFGHSTPSPVVTQMDVNDTLAVVTVEPDLDFSGPITILTGGGTQFSINSETSFPAPEPFVIPQSGGSTPAPVPAPAGAVLLGIGGLIVGVRNRLARR